MLSRVEHTVSGMGSELDPLKSCYGEVARAIGR